MGNRWVQILWLTVGGDANANQRGVAPYIAGSAASKQTFHGQNRSRVEETASGTSGARPNVSLAIFRSTDPATTEAIITFMVGAAAIGGARAVTGKAIEGTMAVFAPLPTLIQHCLTESWWQPMKPEFVFSLRIAKPVKASSSPSFPAIMTEPTFADTPVGSI